MHLWVEQKIQNFCKVPLFQNFYARRRIMMILNLSESLAKPLVMAKQNMAYLSRLNNTHICYTPMFIEHWLNIGV